MSRFWKCLGAAALGLLVSLLGVQTAGAQVTWTAHTYTPPLVAPVTAQGTGNSATFHLGSYWYENNLWGPAWTHITTQHPAQRIQVGDATAGQWDVQVYGPTNRTAETQEAVFGYPDIETRWTSGVPVKSVGILKATWHDTMPTAHYYAESAFTMRFSRTWDGKGLFHSGDVMIWTQNHTTAWLGTYRFTVTIHGVTFYGFCPKTPTMWHVVTHTGTLTSETWFNLVLVPVNAPGEHTFTPSIPAATTEKQHWVWNAGTVHIKEILHTLASTTLGGHWLAPAAVMWFVQYGFETRNTFSVPLNFRVTSYALTFTAR